MPKVLKSTPRRIAKFPPVPADKTHPVSTGDNWWNLASRYGRSDPWDIIEFNFKTRDPREVNWYLEFFVGCKSPSKDGYNLRFDSADSPGLIYIPPASWTPSEDRALRRMVAEALTGPVTARVNVSHGGHLITGRLLAAVGNRVIDGDIGVVFDPRNLNSSEAEYAPATDAFHLGFNKASATTKKALIVHEAVHAALDLKVASAFTVAESESLAYVVQCFYVREQAVDPINERLHDDDPRKDAVYELAWKMAATLGKNVPPGAAEWTALDEAVRKHPTYKKVAGNNAGFDGI